MLLVACPWCDDSMVVDDAASGAVACETCGVTVALAADPVAPVITMPLAA